MLMNISSIEACLDVVASVPVAGPDIDLVDFEPAHGLDSCIVACALEAFHIRVA